MNKPILCLDFDGVLHSYTSPWAGADVVPDPPVKGSIEFLALAIRYFEVQIYSSRSHQPGGISAMREWLRHWLIKSHATVSIDDVNRIEDQVKFPTEKPPAMVTIDDRALRFTGEWGDFDPQKLLKFKPWNKE